jgi:hypothetical protein
MALASGGNVKQLITTRVGGGSPVSLETWNVIQEPSVTNWHNAMFSAVLKETLFHGQSVISTIQRWKKVGENGLKLERRCGAGMCQVNEKLFLLL